MQPSMRRVRVYGEVEGPHDLFHRKIKRVLLTSPHGGIWQSLQIWPPLSEEEFKKVIEDIENEIGGSDLSIKMIKGSREEYAEVGCYALWVPPKGWLGGEEMLYRKPISMISREEISICTYSREDIPHKATIELIENVFRARGLGSVIVPAEELERGGIEVSYLDRAGEVAYDSPSKSLCALLPFELLSPLEKVIIRDIDGTEIEITFSSIRVSHPLPWDPKMRRLEPYYSKCLSFMRQLKKVEEFLKAQQ